MMLFFPAQAMGILGYSQEPEWMTVMQENKMTVFLILFLMSSFAQNLSNTGAFEISMNGKVLFSKLEQGRLPSLKEVSKIFEEYGIQRVKGGQFSGGRF
mmetsp:Transcript_8918/g.10201  ORF Transcript_8918/g.10201 Transcript_8918/m.10201 type:complete len:99 (+) Transcript_8918:567-863(+)